MIKRLTLGIGMSLLLAILPTLGNLEILQAPHLWILFLMGILASVFQPSYNPITITAKTRDKGTAAQIIWSVYLTQGAATLEAAYLRYPDSVRWDLTTSAALVVAALGLALRSWAVLTLGRLFTMHIDIQKDHSVVTAGPFGIVRHPSYLGAFMMYVASTVMLHAWFSVTLALLALPLAFFRRIHHEEELLQGEFGEEYEAYRRRVKGFLPGIW